VKLVRKLKCYVLGIHTINHYNKYFFNLVFVGKPFDTKVKVPPRQNMRNFCRYIIQPYLLNCSKYNKNHMEIDNVQHWKHFGNIHISISMCCTDFTSKAVLTSSVNASLTRSYLMTPGLHASIKSMTIRPSPNDGSLKLENRLGFPAPASYTRKIAFTFSLSFPPVLVVKLLIIIIINCETKSNSD